MSANIISESAQMFFEFMECDRKGTQYKRKIGAVMLSACTIFAFSCFFIGWILGEHIFAGSIIGNITIGMISMLIGMLVFYLHIRATCLFSVQCENMEARPDEV